MSYHSALEAAGAEVHVFESFGSYQGDWWAKVTYKGQTGWIQGSFGSCSGCDAFEAEFDYSDTACDSHRYNEQPNCEPCQVLKKAYEEKLAKFGEGYLDGIISQEAAEEYAGKHKDWDSEAEKMVAFLKEHA